MNNKNHGNIFIVNKIYYVKQHPYVSLAFIVSIVALLRFFFLDVPQIRKSYADRIMPERIYLSIIENNRKMPIRGNGEVISLRSIKEKIPLGMSFALTQGNVNSPQITGIFITFPIDAEVESIPYKGWGWERTNASENQYVLDCSKFIASKGSDYNLPNLRVKFKDTHSLACKYSIIANKIEPIVRGFVITSIDNNLNDQHLEDIQNIASGVVVTTE